MATPFHFFEDMLKRLDGSLTSYVYDVATNVITAIAPLATTLLMIYVMLWGWSMLRGVINEPVMDGVARIVRLALISGIALNLGRYNAFLADWLWQTPDAAAAMIAPGKIDNMTNMQFLDCLLQQMYDLGAAYWHKANALSGVIGVPDVGLTAVALTVWVAGLVASAYGAFLLVLAKMALAILIGLGPLFVLLTLFEPTKRFFDVWIGQTLNYVFLVMLTAAVIKLILSISQAYLNQVDAAGVMADPSITQAMPAVALSLISLLVLMQLPSIASALGGGVAISTLGAVHWTYGRAKGTLDSVRPTTLKRSVNRVTSDVRIAADTVAALDRIPAKLYRWSSGSGKRPAAAA